MSGVRSFRWDHLPRVSRVQARLARLAAAQLLDRPEWGRFEDAVAEFLGGARPTFAAAPPLVLARDDLFARLAAGSPWVAAGIRRLGEPGVALVVDAALVARIAARSLGTPDNELHAPRRSTPVERGVFACLVAATLDACAEPGLVVEGICDEPFALEALLPGAQLVSVDVLCRVERHSGLARWLVPELALAQAAPQRVRPATLARLTVVGRVLAGTVRLLAVEAAALEVGDVVLLDVCHVTTSGEGTVWLNVGRSAFRARCAEGMLHVEGSCGEGANMKDSPDDAVLAELAVDLTCQLATIRMTAKDVLALGPGAVLPLGRPVGAKVELASGSQVVARGELVDVEGEMGVRILEMVGSRGGG